MSNNSIYTAPETSERRRRAAGFSLLELIIAMFIFMLATGAIYGVMVAAQRSRTTVNQQTQMNKNLRIALNLLGRDTYNAGLGYPLKNSVDVPDNAMTTLLGLDNDANAAADKVPPVIAGNDRTTSTFNSVANTKTDQVTFLFKDSTFNKVGATAAKEESQSLNVTTGTVGGINQVTISGATNGVCNVNDIFVIAGDSGSALGVATGKTSTDIVHFADVTADPLNLNQNGTTAPIALVTGVASMQRVRLVTYFVTADGVLTRREFSNVTPADGVSSVAFVDEPLVYGVENFQVQYFLDDGTVSDSPAAGGSVRQIKYTVSSKTIELNAKGEPFQAKMSSTFGTRNLGYDAD